MTNQLSNNNRIAKNTLLLYLRMFFMMGVSLYTSRLVLNALGVEDYGIYSVVGGFISLFAIISNSLTAAISRFITYELGKEQQGRVKEVFSTSVIIQLIIAAIVLLFSEVIGVWFLNTEMTIPTERLNAANWVFQFSLVVFVVNLISVPYNATIIAHEHMKAFAYIGIIDALLKLLSAFLIYISPIDQLIFYAALMCVSSLIVRIIYGIYCNKYFVECKFDWMLNKPLLREIFSFAGWNFIGAGSGVLRDQGVNVLLNIFCGPIVNAARGIAMQVNAAVQQFSNSFTTALNPQITKSFASGDRTYAFKLVFQGAKYSYYLLYIVSLPIILEVDTILKVWLGFVPDYSNVFVQLSLIYVLSESISFTMVTLMLATGNIRNYQILVGGCQMLNFPLSYLLLRNGVSPEYTFIVSIFVAICCLFLRLFMLKRMVALPIGRFFHSVFFKIILVSLASLPLPLLYTTYIESSVLRVVGTVFLSVCTVFISVFLLGCSNNEKIFLQNKASDILKSMFKKIRK